MPLLARVRSVHVRVLPPVQCRATMAEQASRCVELGAQALCIEQPACLVDGGTCSSLYKIVQLYRVHSVSTLGERVGEKQKLNQVKLSSLAKHKLGRHQRLDAVDHNRDASSRIAPFGAHDDLA